MFVNPVIFSLDKIISLKMKFDNNLEDINDVNERLEIIQKITRCFDKFYYACDVKNDVPIQTNAIVTEIKPKVVYALRDDGIIAICPRSCFISYDRRVLAVGDRVYCCLGKNSNVSFGVLTRVTYGKMHDMFEDAIDTTPKRRTKICGTIMFFLYKVYKKRFSPYKIEIRRLMKLIGGS